MGKKCRKTAQQEKPEPALKAIERWTSKGRPPTARERQREGFRKWVGGRFLYHFGPWPVWSTRRVAYRYLDSLNRRAGAE